MLPSFRMHLASTSSGAAKRPIWESAKPCWSWCRDRGAIAYYVESVRRIVGPEGVERPTLYLFGLAVDNLDEALKVVQVHGGEIVRPIWNARTFWGRQAVIKDPGGQQIALREWRAPDGPHFQGWQPETTSDRSS